MDAVSELREPAVLRGVLLCLLPGGELLLRKTGLAGHELGVELLDGGCGAVVEPAGNLHRRGAVEAKEPGECVRDAGAPRLPSGVRVAIGVGKEKHVVRRVPGGLGRLPCDGRLLQADDPVDRGGDRHAAGDTVPGGVRIGETVAVSGLRGYLSKHLAGHGDASVLIEAEDTVPYKAVMDVLDAARDSGAKGAKLAANERGREDGRSKSPEGR